jgi:transposase
MIVREAKLKNGTAKQYAAIDEAIRTAQFIRNKAVRYWMDNQGVSKANLYSLCKDLAKEFFFAKKLNSAARQASVKRAWAAISSFYTRCKKVLERRVLQRSKSIAARSNTRFRAGNYQMIASQSHSLMVLRLELCRYSAMLKLKKISTP